MPSCVLRASLRIACVFTHLHSHRDAYDDMNDADVLVFLHSHSSSMVVYSELAVSVECVIDRMRFNKNVKSVKFIHHPFDK